MGFSPETLCLQYPVPPCFLFSGVITGEHVLSSTTHPPSYLELKSESDVLVGGLPNMPITAAQTHEAEEKPSLGDHRNKTVTPCVRCLNRTAEERSGFFPDLFILMEEDEPSENILLLSPISAFFLLLSHSLQSKTHRVSTHRRPVKSEKQKAGHSERWTHRFTLYLSAVYENVRNWCSSPRKWDRVHEVAPSAFTEGLMLNSQTVLQAELALGIQSITGGGCLS